MIACSPRQAHRPHLRPGLSPWVSTTTERRGFEAAFRHALPRNSGSRRRRGWFDVTFDGAIGPAQALRFFDQQISVTPDPPSRNFSASITRRQFVVLPASAVPAPIPSRTSLARWGVAVAYDFDLHNFWFVDTRRVRRQSVYSAFRRHIDPRSWRCRRALRHRGAFAGGEITALLPQIPTTRSSAAFAFDIRSFGINEASPAAQSRSTSSGRPVTIADPKLPVISHDATPGKGRKRIALSTATAGR